MVNYKSIMYHENILSQAECDRILQSRLKDSTDIQGNIRDFIVFKEQANREWKEILSLIEKRTSKFSESYVSQFFDLMPIQHISISHIGFLNDEEGSFTELHYDWEMVRLKDEIIPKPFTILIYLTRVEEGGELLFPLQKKKFSPQQGSILIFPCHFTHPHVSMPVLGGSKHVCRVTMKMDPEIYKVEELEI